MLRKLSVVLRATDGAVKQKLRICDISIRENSCEVTCAQNETVGIFNGRNAAFGNRKGSICTVFTNAGSNFCIGLFSDDKLKFYGEYGNVKNGREELENAYFQNRTSEESREEYDDFAIAEDNYFGDFYEKKGTSEKIFENSEGLDIERESIVFEKDEDNATKADSDEAAEKSEDSAFETPLDACGDAANGPNESYFESVKDVLQSLLYRFPHEENLERSIPNSSFVKIVYAGEKYYIVGVINNNSAPEYVVFGVPAPQNKTAPVEFNGAAYFIPCNIPEGGYFMVYRSAESGEIIPPRC